MENNEIDDLFRNTIEPVKIEPPAEAWNSLNSRLDERKKEKKKRRFLWLFFPLSVFIISFGSYKFFSRPIEATLSASVHELKKSGGETSLPLADSGVKNANGSEKKILNEANE